MKIELHSSAAAGPAIVDTAELDPEPARELERLVGRIDLVALRNALADRPRGTNHELYDLTIEAAGTSHTVSFSGVGLPPELRALVQRVSELARGR